MFKFLTGFRKFIMALVFLVTAVVLLVTGQIPSVTWMENMKDVMVAFMATNIGEHLINVAKNWITNKKSN